MRQLRYVDFDCPTCAAEHTRFVYFDTELERPDDEPQTCGAFRGVVGGSGINLKTGEVVVLEQQDISCTGILVHREMSAFCGYTKTITKGNHDFSERERARLEKRADDHWKRQGRDEAIDRERMMLKKNGMSGGVI